MILCGRGHACVSGNGLQGFFQKNFAIKVIFFFITVSQEGRRAQCLSCKSPPTPCPRKRVLCASRTVRSCGSCAYQQDFHRPGRLTMQGYIALPAHDILTHDRTDTPQVSLCLFSESGTRSQKLRRKVHTTRQAVLSQ
jgi:hypothetical protein